MNKLICWIVVLSMVLCAGYGLAQDNQWRVKPRTYTTKVEYVQPSFTPPQPTVMTVKEERVVYKTVEVPAQKTKEVNAFGPLLANILFVDEQGHALDCYKGVLVSDIVQTNGYTHFVFEGKPLVSNRKALFSRTYTPNGFPLTGSIFYTLKGGKTSVRVVNVAAPNVYQDKDGTIRYDDLNGRYPLAPKGSRFSTDQFLFPTQP